MARIFQDSVDWYDSAGDAAAYKYLFNTTSLGFATSARGGRCLSFSNLATDAAIAPLGASGTEFYVGCRFRTTSYTGFGASRRHVMYLLENGTFHCGIALASAGNLLCTRAGSTQVGSSTATGLIIANTWYFIEAYLKIHDTAGAFEIWVDGVSMASGTSLDTRNGAGGVANRIKVGGDEGGIGSGSSGQIHDIYVNDLTGSVNNGRAGDHRISAIYPNGNGSSSQLVGSDGNSTDNYLLVDEAVPNEDTDYVASATVGDKDTYAMGAIPTTPSAIYATQEIAIARKDDAGARSIRQVIRSGGTDYDNGADKSLSDSWQSYLHIRETDPATSAAWTQSGVNAVEAGVKIAL